MARKANDHSGGRGRRGRRKGEDFSEAVEAAAAEAAKPAASNVPDEVLERHLDTVRNARAAHREARDAAAEANGVYRAALKAAKRDGIPVDAMTDAVKLMEGDALELKARSQMVRRILVVAKSPLAHLYATQPDLFDEADRARSAHATGSGDQAWTEGRRDGMEGRSLSFCPYAEDTAERVAYTAGWHAGQEELLHKTVTPLRPKGGDGTQPAAPAH